MCPSRFCASVRHNLSSVFNSVIGQPRRNEPIFDNRKLDLCILSFFQVK